MVTTVSHKHFVGYIRVSTEKQAREGHSSLETQEARIRATVSEQNGLLVKLFRDVDSGRRNARNPFLRIARVSV